MKINTNNNIGIHRINRIVSPYKQAEFINIILRSKNSKLKIFQMFLRTQGETPPCEEDGPKYWGVTTA